MNTPKTHCPEYGLSRTIIYVIIVMMLTLLFALGSAQAADTIRILVLGDSLSAGLGLAQKDSFPTQLEAALNGNGQTNVEIINGGVSGDTTTGGLARLDWALFDHPDGIILELGANDSLRALDPALTRSNMDKILALLAEKDLPVLLTGMLAPPNLGEDYSARFNTIFPELAEQYNAILYPFFLDGVAAIPELNQADGIHPNPQGVAVIVERILPYVQRLIEAIES